jgi:zinc and cadmium transporter
MIVAYAFGSVLVVSLISLVGVVALSLREETLRKTLFLLVGLATGALFGDALIHLIPEALSGNAGTEQVALFIMGGILFFFLLEKIFLWRHSHLEHAESGESAAAHDHSPKPLAPLVLVADFIHNLLDGVVIGASFLVSIPVGVSTTLAVILHEIPQEIGDFGLLIHAGWSRGKALLWNFLSALSAVIGVAAALLIGAAAEGFLPTASALTAGAFIYIAGSDLVPELHKTASPARSAAQVVSIIFGFALMYLLTLTE